MAERYEFKTKFEKELENQGKETENKQEKESQFSLWEKPLSEEEIKYLFHKIKNVREEENQEEKRQEIKKLLPHLLGKRWEEKLKKQERKKIIEIEDKGEAEILKPRGYEWFTEENEKKQGLKIRRVVIENEEGKMRKGRTNTIIFSGEEIEAMTDKFLAEIGHLKKEDWRRIEEEKRKRRKQAKKPKGIFYDSK